MLVVAGQRGTIGSHLEFTVVEFSHVNINLFRHVYNLDLLTSKFKLQITKFNLKHQPKTATLKP